MVSFPAPVGGTPQSIDFVPSIVFSALYGLLLPLIIYRLCHRRSRTVLLIGTACFVIERCIIFSLRTVQTYEAEARYSHGLLDYMQISFAVGIIGIANDLTALVRCLLVNPTYGSEKFYESPAAATKEYVVSSPAEDMKDMPRTRFWVRRFTDGLGFLYLASLVPGIVANSAFYTTLEKQGWADRVYELRLSSSAVCLLLGFGLFAGVIWGKRNLERISVRGSIVASVIIALLTVISIYRLSVMPLKVASLDSAAQTNSVRGKVAFYIFHVLPEWLSTATLLGISTRKIFGTGPCGDWRKHDETEKEKTKRLEKEAKKAAKKTAKFNAEHVDIEINEKETQLVEKIELVSSPIGRWSFK